MKAKKNHQHNVKFTDEQQEYIQWYVQTNGMKGIPALIQQLVTEKMIKNPKH